MKKGLNDHSAGSGQCLLLRVRWIPKLATCSEDGSVRIFGFFIHCVKELIHRAVYACVVQPLNLQHWWISYITYSNLIVLRGHKLTSACAGHGAKCDGAMSIEWLLFIKLLRMQT